MMDLNFDACPACGAKLLMKRVDQIICDYCRLSFVITQEGIRVASRFDPDDKNGQIFSADLAIDEFKRDIEEVKRYYMEKEQQIIYRHLPGGDLSAPAVGAMAVLIKFFDGDNVTLLFDREKFIARFQSLSNGDIDFLINEAHKYAADPKIYEKPEFAALYKDLREIRDLRAERDHKIFSQYKKK